MGQIGNERGRGFFVQTVLAVRPQTREVLGCMAQEPFVRIPAPDGEQRHQRRKREERETDVWIRQVHTIGTSASGNVWIRQAIVDAHTEYSALSLHEIASIYYMQFRGKPSPHTIQYILATGPNPSRTSRRYKRFAEIDDPVERRRVILKLHAEGWTPTSIGRVACHHPMRAKGTLDPSLVFSPSFSNFLCSLSTMGLRDASFPQWKPWRMPA